MDKYSGKILYEYSDSKHALDMTKSERRRYIKSFTAVWIMICVLLLTAWCIVNCVLDVRLYGSSAVKSYVFMFIVLGVIILITVLTVFGLWGIFMRKVSKSYRPREIESRRRMEELQSEFRAIDAHKSCENSLTIYGDRIVIKTKCVDRVIDRSELSGCSMINSNAGLYLVFCIRNNNEKIPVGCLLPRADAYLLKKYLGDELEEIKVPKIRRRTKTGEADEVAGRNKRSDAKIGKRKSDDTEKPPIEKGALFAGAACIVVGIAITLLGYFDVMGGMPAIVGGFPIGLGMLFIVLAFYRFEIVNVFVIKVAVAAMFIFMGIMFLIVIEEGVTKAPVTFASLLRHPTDYALACLFFVSVGISFIPNAIKSIVEYIKYR